MAFGDSNDIKINVTLNTEGAIQSANELKSALESSLAIAEKQFQKLDQISKSYVANLSNGAQQQVTVTKQTYDQIVASANDAAAKRIAADQRAANEKAKIALRERDVAAKETALRLRDAEAAAAREVEIERTKRVQILKEIELVRQQTAAIKKAPRGSFPNPLEDEGGSGKILEEFKKLSINIGNRFGFLGGTIGQFSGVLKALAQSGSFGAITTGLTGIATAANLVQQRIDPLVAEAGRLEGLRTGFETLQRSIGESPVKSIENLRKATQGLVSDVDLYQRANQAVLLGVPTDTFNEAAAAAVKLGRAMGIDASAGLESLSLGLGRQSRLYLDNLGIIVSAEEAYANFAKTVNKNVADLTDAEKKAAFFAEALKKIKERADELPDPFDSVATAQQKANVAQQNANQLFLEGINSSKGLTEAYQAQQAITNANAENLYIFGAALGDVVAPLIALKDGLKAVAAVGATAFASALDFIFRYSPEKRIADLNEAIKESEERLKELRQEQQTQDPTSFWATITRSNIANLTAELEKNKAELVSLRTEADNLSGKTINIKVLVDGITEAQSAIGTLFTNLQTQAEQQAGIFKVEGLPEQQTADIFKRLTDAKVAFDQSLQDTTALNKYKAEVAAVQQEITGAPFKEAVSNIGEAGSALATSIKNLDFAGVKDSLADVADGVADVTKGVKAQNVQQKQLQALLKGVDSAAQKYITKYNKGLKQSNKELDKQEKELKDFTRGLKRALEQAIPADIQKELVDAFNDPQLSVDQLAEKIQELGIKFKNAGGDVGAFIKEAAALNDLKQAKPELPLIETAEATKNARQIKDDIQQAQKGIVNLKELFSDQESTGAFFGFDLSNVGLEAEGQLAGIFQDSISSALQTAADGVSRSDAPRIGAAVGAVIGAAISTYFTFDPSTGAAIGSVIGEFVGTAVGQLGKDLPGTREKKEIDKYFADLFAGERLGVVINEQITALESTVFGQVDTVVQALGPKIKNLSDLVFEGLTPAGGPVNFGGENFTTFFSTLDSNIQATFNGIGLAFGKLNGIASEQARLIGIAIANNVGGSLQNLQVLVQQTGESFEDLSNAILQSFRDSQLTAEEAYNSLVQLQDIYQVGIPGAIGDFEQAIENLNNRLQTDQPGQYALDSLRDIGAEGEEARASFETVISSLGQTFGFAAQQQVRLFDALRASGISSLQQLAKASDEQLITLIRNINAIKENAEAPLATVPVLPQNQPKTSGGRDRGKSKEEEARDLLKKQREEARKLTQASAEYLQIIEQINARQIKAVAAGEQISKLNQDILKTIQRRDKVESQLNSELDKGAKGNKKRIAELSAELAKLEERLKKVRDEAKANERQYKELNISGIIPLIKSQNDLGSIARQVGIDLNKNIDILVKGFIQGRLSISEVNSEIEKTKELLGPGIPGAVGAVTDAFQNLINAGQKGGQFSLDAFTDIFAEFREKFKKEGSELRKAQGEQLRANLDAARRASAAAVGPEAVDATKKSLELAKKELQDFYAQIPLPDLADLRAQLETTFAPTEVAKFFQALDESGLKTFEEFEKAGNETIISILGRLQELGFQFGTTSENTQKINQGLQNAEKAANAGLDPLKEAINLVKQFNEGAGALPPVFDATTNAINTLNGPLTTLARGFDNIIEKLGQLSGQTFENDVVFNVRTTGDAGGKALVELIFGDGSDVNAGTGFSGVGGNQDKQSAQIAKIKAEMQKLKKEGLRTQAQRKRYNDLKKRLAALGG